MAKRTVKTPKVVTLGEVLKTVSGKNVKFTFASKLARLKPENDLQDGYAILERHIAAGNIVDDSGVGVGYFPGVQTYIMKKPDAPALI